MGNAFVNVSVEKIQNKVATIIGENQKNFRSFPDKMPIKIERAGFTTKKRRRQIIIPASEDAK